MKYRTVKRLYPILVTLYNIEVSIDDWLFKNRKNLFLYYLYKTKIDLQYGGHFKDSTFYYCEIAPRMNKLIRLVFSLFGNIGLNIINRITNDWGTKLLDCNPRFCHTRSRGYITRYYTCKLYPFNYMKLNRMVYNAEDEEGINLFCTTIFSILGGKSPSKITTNDVCLYKGFVWNKKEAIKIYRTYKKDLIKERIEIEKINRENLEKAKTVIKEHECIE